MGEYGELLILHPLIHPSLHHAISQKAATVRLLQGPACLAAGPLGAQVKGIRHLHGESGKLSGLGGTSAANMWRF